MKSRICIISILGLLLMIPGANYAQGTRPIVKKDTVRSSYIYFSFNQDEIDPDYLDNSETIATLDALLADSLETAHPDSLIITSLIVPEGSLKFNAWLAARRAEAVRDYINERYPRLHTKFVLCRKETDWMDWRTLIASDPGVPDQEDVLRVIDYHHYDPAKCEKLLQYLNGKKPYTYIQESLLPRLHRTEIQVSWNYADLVAPLNGVEPVSGFASTVGQQSPALLTESIEPEDAGSVLITPKRRKTILALKNNLLYDIALAPNLELEIPLGRRWSVNAEYKCPWWLNNERNFCYQLVSGGIEGRCWLGNRRTRDPLIGHFFGLYAEGGNYDFQFGEITGYRGKYYAAGGLSYGYTRRIGRHFSLEFSLGVGCLTTDFHTYLSDQGELSWKDTRRIVYIGPTKVNCSLVWLISVKR